MAGIDGLETLTRLRELDPRATVVMISGHGTIADGGRGDPARRLRLPREAARHRPAAGHGPQRAAATSSSTGENERLQRGRGRAATRMVGTSSPRCTAVRELIEQGRARPTRACSSRARTARARSWSRGRIHDALAARGRAVRRGQLRRDPVRADRERAVRAHEGLVHRRRRRPRRASSSRPTAARSSSTRSATCRSPAQAKLLRVLQEGVVTRIGGTKSMQVDVRVLAATNKDLARGDRRRAGSARTCSTGSTWCRSDVPPLRERREDIPLLVAHFARADRRRGRACRRAASATTRWRGSQQRAWPGNVRELRNAVERLLILAPRQDRSRRPTSTGCSARGARTAGAAGAAAAPTRTTFETFKQEAEKDVPACSKLREHDWNVSETARALEMPRSNLYKKIERYGLQRESAMTGPAADWDKELAAIDKAIERLAGERPAPAPAAARARRPHAARRADAPSARAGRPGHVAARAAGAGPRRRRCRSGPTRTRCGINLFLYLGAARLRGRRRASGARSPRWHRRLGAGPRPVAAQRALGARARGAPRCCRASATRRSSRCPWTWLLSSRPPVRRRCPTHFTRNARWPRPSRTSSPASGSPRPPATTSRTATPPTPRDLIGRFPDSGAADVEAAVRSARARVPALVAHAGAGARRRAAPRRRPPRRRARRRSPTRMTREMGKVLAETRGDVQEGIDTAYYAATEGRRLFGHTVPSELRNKWAMSYPPADRRRRASSRRSTSRWRSRPGRCSRRCSAATR